MGNARRTHVLHVLGGEHNVVHVIGREPLRIVDDLRRDGLGQVIAQVDEQIVFLIELFIPVQQQFAGEGRAFSVVHLIGTFAGCVFSFIVGKFGMGGRIELVSIVILYGNAQFSAQP